MPAWETLEISIPSTVGMTGWDAFPHWCWVNPLLFSLNFYLHFSSIDFQSAGCSLVPADQRLPVFSTHALLLLWEEKVLLQLHNVTHTKAPLFLIQHGASVPAQPGICFYRRMIFIYFLLLLWLGGGFIVSLVHLLTSLTALVAARSDSAPPPFD